MPLSIQCYIYARRCYCIGGKNKNIFRLKQGWKIKTSSLGPNLLCSFYKKRLDRHSVYPQAWGEEDFWSSMLAGGHFFKAGGGSINGEPSFANFPDLPGELIHAHLYACLEHVS